MMRSADDCWHFPPTLAAFTELAKQRYRPRCPPANQSESQSLVRSLWGSRRRWRQGFFCQACGAEPGGGSVIFVASSERASARICGIAANAIVSS
jgi:hypothetical protein